MFLHPAAITAATALGLVSGLDVMVDLKSVLLPYSSTLAFLLSFFFLAPLRRLRLMSRQSSDALTRAFMPAQLSPAPENIPLPADFFPFFFFSFFCRLRLQWIRGLELHG